MAQLVEALAKAKKPVIISGSGVIWSRAWDEMKQFVEAAGIPFYTTPQGRGVVPDDHDYSYMSMRSSAFKDADLILVLGTRMNYIISHAAPPRWNAKATIARIDIDPVEIATAAREVHIPIVGDVKMVLNQVMAGMKGKVKPDNLQGLACIAGRRRREEAQGRGRQQVRRGWRHPSAAAVRGDRGLQEARLRSWSSTARKS